MKNLCKTLVFSISIMLISNYLSANNYPLGYWVIEKNQQTQQFQASYYDANAKLLYQSWLKARNFALNSQTLANLNKRLSHHLQKRMIQKGYWVTESNAYTRNFTIVRFYNEQNQQIFEEKLEGKFLKLNSRNIKRLNRSLKAFLINQPLKLNL